MAVVKKLGVKRKEGYLYFIDSDGDVSRTKRGTGRREKVKKAGIKKQKGYLYFLDSNGDIGKAKMKRR